MTRHIINGQFQSDKYPTCPAGKVPLSVKDTMAQDLLWTYAYRRAAVDEEFGEDLRQALRTAGYNPARHPRYYAQFADVPHKFASAHATGWVVYDRNSINNWGAAESIAFCTNRDAAYAIRDSLNKDHQL